jgi:NTP pyrophosphatase (non-canonical NTP hydrolase)
MRLQKLLSKAHAFREEREWKQYHSARNVALSVVLEAAELLEIFQWKTDKESEEITRDPATRQKISDELADILLYIMLMADDLDIDLVKAAKEKIEKNAAKYPIDKSKGKALKYTEL